MQSERDREMGRWSGRGQKKVSYTCAMMKMKFIPYNDKTKTIQLRNTACVYLCFKLTAVCCFCLVYDFSSLLEWIATNRWWQKKVYIYFGIWMRRRRWKFEKYPFLSVVRQLKIQQSDFIWNIREKESKMITLSKMNTETHSNRFLSLFYFQ